MIIKFGDNAGDSYIHALNVLAGWTLKGEFTNPGFPENCAIYAADSNDVTFCEVDDTGRAITNMRFHVGYDEIVSITVI